MLTSPAQSASNGMSSRATDLGLCENILLLILKVERNDAKIMSGGFSFRELAPKSGNASLPTVINLCTTVKDEREEILRTFSSKVAMFRSKS